MSETLRLKKPLVYTIAAGLAVITGFLIYSVMVAPARQPYRDALAQYKNVDRALAQTNIALNTGTANDQEFQKSIDASKKSFTSLAAEDAALAKKGVLKDGEGRALYEPYHQKLVEYTTYSNNVITSMVKIRPVLVKCSTAMNTATQNTEGAAVLKACSDEMKAASDVPDADYKQLAESFSAIYGTLGSSFEQIAGLQDPKGADAVRLGELEAERDQAMKDFEQAGKTFSANVQEQRRSILATDVAKKLLDYLSAKSRVF